MARVAVTHKALTGDDATTAPKREPVPPGKYHAIIMNVAEGSTKHKAPMSKISVEFQIVYRIAEDNSHDDQHQARRVYQDFILEDDESMPDLSEQRRYELRMLLDACDIPFDDAGFDTDDLKEKPVIITVRHREGNSLDDDGNKRVFSNVVKVDSAEAIAAEDLV
jgi:hypothetical protein